MMKTSDRFGPGARWGRRSLCAFVVLAGMFWNGIPARAAGALYEEEIKISRDVQERLQKELDRVFGAHRTSVLVRVELMIEPGLRRLIERTISQSLLGESLPRGGSESGGPVEFLWKGESKNTGSFILPGFPAKDRPAPSDPADASAEGAGSAGFKSQATLDVNSDLILTVGTAVRRIVVKLSLDQGLPKDAESSAVSLVETFLSITRSRGDVLSTERVSMPPFWTRYLEQPQTLSDLLQKGVLSFALLGAVLLLGMAASRVTRSVMHSGERIAGLISRAFEKKALDIDVDYDNAGEGKPGLPAPDGGKGPEALPALPQLQPAFQLNVGMAQVEKLFFLLHQETPENIAVVLPSMGKEVRQAFLSLLPAPTKAEVLSALGSVRFLEPEMLLRLKQELEHRLEGAIGGADEVVQLLQNSDTKSRREFLEILSQKNPALARLARSRVFFFEDLLALSAEEFQLVLTRSKLDELATALLQGPENLLQRVRTALPPKVQNVLQEMMTFRAKPSDDKIAECQDKVLAILSALIQEGLIQNPTRLIEIAGPESPPPASETEPKPA